MEDWTDRVQHPFGLFQGGASCYIPPSRTQGKYKHDYEEFLWGTFHYRGQQCLQMSS